MIKVFKIGHNYYDPGASVKFNFNPFGITRSNKVKLQKYTCHCNIRKYSFCSFCSRVRAKRIYLHPSYHTGLDWSINTDACLDTCAYNGRGQFLEAQVISNSMDGWRVVQRPAQ